MQVPDVADLSKEACRACAVEEWGALHDQLLCSAAGCVIDRLELALGP